MKLKFRLLSLRSRALLVIAIVALTVAMLPTAAFAQQYGNQGRAYDPRPRQQAQQNYSNSGRDDHKKNDNKKNNDHKKNDDKKHDDKKKDDRKKDDKKNDDKKHNNRCETTYKVKRGDTLSGIAHHFHISQQKLAKANGIKNPNHIFAGQRLCIPG
jgi:LysM repeat protein